jgi:hypothetical protein
VTCFDCDRIWVNAGALPRNRLKIYGHQGFRAFSCDVARHRLARMRTAQRSRGIPMNIRASRFLTLAAATLLLGCNQNNPVPTQAPAGVPVPVPTPVPEPVPIPVPTPAPAEAAPAPAP